MTLTVTRQMIGAEVLKLRRNRGVMIFASLLTVGMIVLLYGYVALKHAGDPLNAPPAGGMIGLRRGILDLGQFFGMLAAVLIGAEAGTADLSSGVFRDLVTTGRSRLALFGVRLPAAAIVTLCFTMASYAIALLFVFALPGKTPTPGLGLVLQGAGWIVLANLAVVAVSVGIGSLTGSRAVTLTAVIGWQAILTNILVSVGSLGGVRDVLLTPALGQLLPVSGGPDSSVAMATGIAVFVVCAWIFIPQAIGAWRTRTADA
jgi:hypothetical protein